MGSCKRCWSTSMTKRLQLLQCRFPPPIHSELILFSLILGFIFGLVGWSTARASPPRPDSEPDSMIPEVFQEPQLSENPTQVEQGAYSYFYHCMPCHGDHGQGLTDEFRMLWVPDHQNCWAPGCHVGREGDEGFPIPRTVPGLLALDRFPDPESLFIYLKVTHPPQRPGALEDMQYWATTAYLLSLSGRLAADGHIGPADSPPDRPAAPTTAPVVIEAPLHPPPTAEHAHTLAGAAAWWTIAIVSAVILFISLALIWQARSTDTSFISSYPLPASPEQERSNGAD
jgi:hypothetical protein